MATKTVSVTQDADRVTLERECAAPRDTVFRAFTDPGVLVRWWGPNGFTTPHCTMDVRPDGVFHYCMRGPDGREYWGLGTYREIIVPERIVYVDAFSDEFGSTVPPTAYGLSEEHPLETLVTLSFTDLGGSTAVTIEYALPAALPERDGAIQGWSEMLDRLAARVEGEKPA